MSRVEIFLATGNAHKVAEMQALVESSKLAVQIRSAKEAGGMPAVVEDAGTFEGNAAKKARALAAQLGGRAWVMADDSGLCVDALGGAPGVESAYYAGPKATAAENLQKLVLRMRGEAERRAHFRCVLCVIGPGVAEQIFSGRCDGHLLAEPEGGGGFGYDPLFVPEGFSETFATLGDAAKNTLSHRGRAWAAFAKWWGTR